MIIHSRNYPCLLNRYYAEFVRVNDVAALAPLFASAGAIVTSAQELLGDLLDELRFLDPVLADEANAAPSDVHYMNGFVDASAAAAVGAGAAGAGKGTETAANEADEGSASAAISGVSLFAPTAGRQATTPFAAFRMMWDRCTSWLSSRAMAASTKDPVFDSLTARMQAVVQRTTFLDCLPRLLKEHFEPYEAWWFRDQLWAAYCR